MELNSRYVITNDGIIAEAELNWFYRLKDTTFNGQISEFGNDIRSTAPLILIIPGEYRRDSLKRHSCMRRQEPLRRHFSL